MAKADDSGRFDVDNRRSLREQRNSVRRRCKPMPVEGTHILFSIYDVSKSKAAPVSMANFQSTLGSWPPTDETNDNEGKRLGLITEIGALTLLLFESIGALFSLVRFRSLHRLDFAAEAKNHDDFCRRH